MSRPKKKTHPQPTGRTARAEGKPLAAGLRSGTDYDVTTVRGTFGTTPGTTAGVGITSNGPNDLSRSPARAQRRTALTNRYGSRGRPAHRHGCRRGRERSAVALNDGSDVGEGSESETASIPASQINVIPRSKPSCCHSPTSRRGIDEDGVETLGNLGAPAVEHVLIAVRGGG
jgi:hypothetical protein